jgi:hypothetical protein
MNSMRILLILLFEIVFFSAIYAQTPKDDVVYMNSGSFLRGRIVEMIPGKSLKICLANNRDTLMILMEDVKLIRQEDPPRYEPSFSNQGFKRWEYTVMAEFGCGLGFMRALIEYSDTRESQSSLMFNVINGFKVSPRFQLGLGCGIDFWSTMTFFPMYANLRWNFSKTEPTFFAYTDGGYSFGWMKDYGRINMGGIMAAAGLGVKFRISSKMSMFVTAGYKLQRVLGQWQDSYPIRWPQNAHFFNFKTGVDF